MARWLGIGRGADLVSYLAIGVMFVGFFVTYVRLRALRRELTLLVRRVALHQAGGGEGERSAEETDAGPPVTPRGSD